MKGKPLILTLFWTLFLACGFQYFLLFSTTCIEWNLEEKAMIDALQAPDSAQFELEQQFLQHYLDSMTSEVVLNIPYVTAFTYAQLKQQQLQLGLDLKGGMALTLGIDRKWFIQSLLNNEEDVNVQQALNNSNELTSVYSADFIATFFEQYEAIEKRENIIHNFAHHPQLRKQLNEEVTVGDLKNSVQDLVKMAVQQTEHSIRERCDGLGLLQMQIHSNLEQQQIYVELPGVQNPERIRKMLTSIASLEFWPTYRITDPGIREAFIQADRMLDKVEKNGTHF